MKSFKLAEEVLKSIGRDFKNGVVPSSFDFKYGEKRDKRIKRSLEELSLLKYIDVTKHFYTIGEVWKVELTIEGRKRIIELASRTN